ncbi:hypothetical protein [Desulfolucanica intricata]|nr:hypothetical protein [Desulfolucanica intricata]
MTKKKAEFIMNPAQQQFSHEVAEEIGLVKKMPKDDNLIKPDHM